MTDFERLITDLRGGVAKLMLGAAGMDVNYTPESLDELETIINSMFTEGQDVLPTTYIPFGFYVGETIVQNIPGAKWDFSEAKDYFDEIAVDVKHADGNSARVYPFRRTIKFFNDRTDGLSVFYRMIQLMAAGGLNADGVQEGQWVKFPNGDMFRVTGKMKKEEYDKQYGSGHPYN